ncbi:MAG TPA: FtsQ-type POTRA domain-containing protein, partial [Candidatus Limnocylindrales bacterium]
TRAAAILAMLIAAGAIYGLSATAAFGFDRLEVTGAALTDEVTVRTAVGLEPGTNLVGLATGPIADRLRILPTVHDVRIAVGLPNVLQVNLAERRPILVWAVGDRRLAVDDAGLLFADVTLDPSGTTQGIPVVSDERSSATGLRVASSLDPIDLDAATRLGSIVPAQVGSHAAAFRVHVTDERGFTISSGRGGWVAVFGFYGRNARTPALIPGQVQLLAGLLANREDTVESVILADDREGTFIAKPTPRPSASPRP